MPNLKHLYYFHIYAQELSTLRAAKILKISSPALSNQLKHLEDHLGIPLTRRINGKTSITKQGELVKKYTDRMFSAYSELQNKLSLDKRIRGNRLRVGICNYVDEQLAFDMVSFLKNDHSTPCENLKVAFDSSDQLVNNFQQELFEIVIGSFEKNIDEKIHCISKHLDLPIRFFVPSQLLVGEDSILLKSSNAGISRIIEIANNNNISMVIPLHPSLLREEIGKYISNLSVRPVSIIECNSSSMISQLIERGLSMGFIPTVQPSSTNLKLTMIGPSEGLWNHRVSVLIKKNEARLSKIYSSLDDLFSI